MAIFEHEDNSGDAFEIVDSPRAGELAIYWAEDNASYVNLNPAAVNRLHAALGQWLAGNNITMRSAVRPEPPYETLVRRLVAEEVARVLPLHQSPQAAVRCDGTACCTPRPMDPEPQHASNTGLPLCTDPFCRQTTPHADHDPNYCRGGYGCDPDVIHPAFGPGCGRPDPEPKAVGHPEAPGIDWTDKLGVRYEYCTECGHVWGIHAPDDSRPGCVATLGKGRCGCEAIRPERPTGCECGHAWVDHGRFGVRGCGVLFCECSRAVPRSTT